MFEIKIASHFFQVVREEGLDKQNYECSDCSKAIGTLFGPAKVCSYTKLYYCDECHLDEASVIPSKIVYSWNFQTYKVFLGEVYLFLLDAFLFFYSHFL